MKQQIGMLLQLFVLGGLPVLVYFQLTFGFRLIVMPACLLAGIVVFTIGTRMRESCSDRGSAVLTKSVQPRSSDLRQASDFVRKT